MQDAVVGAALSSTSHATGVAHFKGKGFEYEVSGVKGKTPRTLAQMSASEREYALQGNPTAAHYLSEPKGMYYYEEGACVLGAEGRRDASLATLRDFAATVNVMPAKIAEALGLRIVPTSTLLSTSLELKGSVRGELDRSEVRFVLLPGTPHTTALPLAQTLVVDVEPDLFQLLVGNAQAALIGDGIRSYPSPSLHFHPNLVESPEYIVTMPMRPFPSNSSSFKAACAVACTSASSSPSGSELGGGSCAR